MLELYVDADACPVKAEVYRVAERYRLQVHVVSNTRMQVPSGGGRIRSVQVGAGLDVADDWIAERISAGDICITADIPLAARCLEQGAAALDPRGKAFTEDSIGDALATRELMANLREVGEARGGPPPLAKRDRSQFLQSLDQIIQRLRRENGL